MEPNVKIMMYQKITKLQIWVC